MAEIQEKNNAGRKPLDTVNGESKTEKLMMYFTPTLLKKIRAWCRIKDISCVSYITALIEAEIATHEGKINAFIQLIGNENKPETLSPCPFCGCVAKLYQAYDSSFSVQCETCGNRTLSFKQPEKARQAWNNRKKV